MPSPLVTLNAVQALEEGRRYAGDDHGPLFLFPLLLLGLLAFLLVRLVRRRRGLDSHHGSGSASAVLEDRFARGDIDRAEYEHRKAVLNGDEVIPPAPLAATVPTGPSTSMPDSPSTSAPSSGDEIAGAPSDS